MAIAFSNEIEIRIIVDCPCTEAIFESLQKLIAQEYIIPERFNKATLCYNAFNGNGIPGTEQFYPLKFLSPYKSVWVSNVTSGFNDEGAQTTIAALKLMGFQLTKEEEHKIINDKKLDVTFTK